MLFYSALNTNLQWKNKNLEIKQSAVWSKVIQIVTYNKLLVIKIEADIKFKSIAGNVLLHGIIYGVKDCFEEY